MTTLFEPTRQRFVLRDYQAEAHESCIEHLREHGSALCQLPTGMGKTVVCCAVIQSYLNLSQRVLFLAHRRELIRQAAKSIEAYTGIRPDVEMASEKAPNVKSWRSSIVVASKDSMNKKRCEKYDRDHFGLIITDESHHATADSYTSIYDYFKSAHHLGVTATPERGDGIGLHNVYNSVAYQMELRHAIQLGWLVPIDQRFVNIKGLDLSKTKTHGGDFSGKDLARTIEETDGALAEMAMRTVELAGERRTLIFAPSVAQAEIAASIINDRLGREAATCVFGKTPEEVRDLRFDKFAHGEYQFLLSVDVPTEGWDDPASDGKGVQVVAIWRPTQVRSRYAQQVGRGTRPLKGTVEYETPEERLESIASSAKPSVTVLDFIGNSGKHKLVNAYDLLAGKEIDDEFRAELQDREGAGLTIDELEEAQSESALRRAEAIRQAEQEAAERARPFRVYQPRGRTETRSVNPFDGSDRTPYRAPFYMQRKRPSPKQSNLLISRGLADEEQVRHMSMADADEIIHNYFRATPKQIDYLRKLGYEGSDDITKARASELIGELKAQRAASRG